MSFLRIPTAIALTACVISGALIACVSDTGTTSSGGTKLDSGTGSDAEVTLDSGSTDASTCSVPTDNGVSCFPTRCKAVVEACCVSLGGGNTLTGVCLDKGDAALATCKNANAALWECDRAKDCPSGGSRCCIPNLFKLVNDKVCPIKIGLNDTPEDAGGGPQDAGGGPQDGGGGPKDGKATRCTQSACEANEIIACQDDGDCSAADKCFPAVLQGKVIGICRNR